MFIKFYIGSVVICWFVVAAAFAELLKFTKATIDEDLGKYLHKRRKESHSFLYSVYLYGKVLIFSIIPIINIVLFLTLGLMIENGSLKTKYLEKIKDDCEEYGVDYKERTDLKDEYKCEAELSGLVKSDLEKKYDNM